MFNEGVKINYEMPPCRDALIDSFCCVLKALDCRIIFYGPMRASEKARDAERGQEKEKGSVNPNLEPKGHLLC